MQRPRYPLEEVKVLAEKLRNGEATGFFSAPNASINYVIYIFECLEREAENIILDGLQKLEENDFCKQAFQWDVVVDIYGLENYLGYDWFVKFFVEDGILEEISFHPLEKAMRLVDGRNLEPVIDGSKIPPWRRKE